MTSNILAACALIAAAPPSGSGLPTDRLDAYADQVELNRKSCGPTALWYCFRQHGIDVDRQSLCREADLRSDGTTLEALIRVSNARGLSASGLFSPTKNLDTLPVPSILIVDQVHCVVYQGIGADGDTVTFFEPATARTMTASREKVVRNWTGEAIVFERPRLPTTVLWMIAMCAAVVTGCVASSYFRAGKSTRDVPSASASNVAVAEVQ